jgi:hypothetical protein
MLRATVFLTLAVVLAGCRPSEPLVIRTVQVGRSLNSDNSVGALTTRFEPEDTIYVSVLTAAPGTSTITAKWYYQGVLINESSKEGSYRDAAATEFHLLNTSGFPAGAYRIEILIDGELKETRNFTVAN